MAYYKVLDFPLLTLIILRDPIRVDIYKVFIMYLITITFSTLTCLLINSLFSLSFDKEAGKIIETLYLRDRSLPLVKIVFSI